ncbi:TetR family transcriptional regulator [Bifidobacterium ramosum]|uniref:TetR family transcriptional regulator n=1 Tax=Bifidobacterium ramosum TaxID=1798158 RepID=A0A6L4WY42_9BIFI|nr:TetR family transcriptional regulator [Bifidobacterium ramosum]KAB8287004.1 TetR family transcriptional regulator [Bifidobacterium ramosum]NEG72489.1 TetR family transcriptional regulator [Bifidobacterium ramosum]
MTNDADTDSAAAAEPDGADRAASSPRQPRRFDPDRKQRIIEACLDVIAERGVRGTSHRVVAAAANVPLGSMTYHFDGMDDLLHQTFDQYAQQCIDRFAARMAAATTPDEACEQIARHIESDLLGTQRDLTINLEFYTLAARDPSYRDVTDRWMAASRAELERFFDAPTAMLMDAMIEGMSLHRALDDVPRDAQTLRDGFRRIAGLS